MLLARPLAQAALAALPLAPVVTLLAAASAAPRVRPEAAAVLVTTALVAAPLLAAALAPDALPSLRPSRVAFGVVLMCVLVPAGVAVLAVAIDGLVCRPPGPSLVGAGPGWLLGAAAGYALGSSVAMRHPRALAWVWPLAVAGAIVCGLLVASAEQPCRPDR